MDVVAEFVSPMPPAIIPVAVLAVLAMSGTVYYLLVHRWTTQRRWMELTEWADANRFKVGVEGNAVGPEVLRVLGEPAPRVLLSLNDPDTAVVQVETRKGVAATEVAAAVKAGEAQRWNLLVRRLESSWPVTGLRPVSHVHSVLDLLGLGEFPTMLAGERFIAYGHESGAAKALAKSHVQGLLPADVGVLLAGHSLVLDFSTRPFDPIEIQRIDQLAEQLVTHLPVVRKG